MTVGTPQYQYEAVAGWGKLPDGWKLGDATGVAVDSKDQVFVFSRSKNPLCVFSSDGEFIKSWGEGVFQRPHGVFISPNDEVYCTDDWGHSVRKFTPDGRLLLTIESAADNQNGFKWNDPATIQNALPPFHYPTDTALAADGDIFVSDGYGNARVHRFSPEGELRYSWGEPGTGPGQFMTVHDVALDADGFVYIADRENSRVQVFTPTGEFVRQWSDTRRPNMIAFDSEGIAYVSEMGRKLSVSADGEPPIEGEPARITVRNRAGDILAEWGAQDPANQDIYFAPHGIAVDSQGSVYVSEVSATFSRGRVASSRPVLHKYVRR